MATTVGMSDFAKRQTANSSFSHFNGTWEELTELVRECLFTSKPSFRDGVIQVFVPEERFYSGIVELAPDSVLESVYRPRTDGEKSGIETVVKGGAKSAAKHVVVILYSHEALSENGGKPSTDCDWEIVSINASPVKGSDAPMTPMAMARNFLELPGGTKTEYTAQQFAESISYWNTHAMVKAG